MITTIHLIFGMWLLTPERLIIQSFKKLDKWMCRTSFAIFCYILLYFGQWSSKQFPGPVGGSPPGGPRPFRDPARLLPRLLCFMDRSTGGAACCALRCPGGCTGGDHLGTLRARGDARRWGDEPMIFGRYLVDIWWNRRVYAGGIGGILWDSRFLR